MGSVLTILGRFWSILAAFIGGCKTRRSSSVLPLSMKTCKKSNFFGWRGRNRDDPTIGEAQKEEFLRHPSLRVKQGRHPNKAKAKANRSHKRHKSSLLAQVTVNLHDWCTQAPPRPPRPPSGPVPSVVVTPCTPTADGFLSVVQECIYSTPRLSPWDFAVELVQPTESDAHPAHVQHERKLTSSARDNKQGSDSPTNEKDITEWEVTDARDALASSPESPEKSFALSDSLPSMTNEQMWHNFKVHSAVSALLRNSSVWINSGSPTKFLPNSYVTSTPTKKPQTDNRRLALKRRVEFDTPSPYNAGTPQTLRLPDEQLDLLPYPDVFDFDMYYGVASQRASDSIDTPSFSLLMRHSFDYDKNPFAPQASSPYLSSSPSPSVPNSSPSGSDDVPYKPPRRVGFVSETPDVSVDYEIKRYRDHYRHPAFSVSPRASSENTSGDSLTNYTPTPNPRAMAPYLPASGAHPRPALSLPLRDGHSNTRSVMNDVVDLSTRAPRPSGSRLPETTKRPLTRPPIVVVSHHRFGTSPPASLGDTDAPSEVLKTGLRETRNLFAKSVSTDNSYSMTVL